jgi:hypothetical protein
MNLAAAIEALQPADTAADTVRADELSEEDLSALLDGWMPPTPVLARGHERPTPRRELLLAGVKNRYRDGLIPITKLPEASQ